MTDSNSDVENNRLRDILGCVCAFAEVYNGEEWNNKTQEYQDCSCVEKLKELKSLISEQGNQAEEKLLEKLNDEFARDNISPGEYSVIRDFLDTQLKESR